MAQLYEVLKPVKDYSMEAYYLDDVYRRLSSSRRKELRTWIAGRITLLLEGEREIIYRHDLDHFFDTMV